MAILASPQNRLAAAFVAALLCHGALLMLERAPPQTPQPTAPGMLTISLTRSPQPMGAERAKPESLPEALPKVLDAPRLPKSAKAATRQTGERLALAERSTAPGAPPAEATRPALSDLLAAARRYSEAPEVRRLGPGTVLTPAEDAYLRGWRTRIERLGMVNFPPEARRAAERAGGQATLRLRAELHRDGRLGALAVVIGSGDAAVDQAALTLVRSAHPYLPFPKALSQHPRLEIVRDFNFRLP